MDQQRPTDEQLDRLLGGRAHLGVSEREQVLERVLARSAASPPRRVSRPWLWAVGLAAASVIAIVVWKPAEPDLVARGQPTRPSLTLSCLVDGQVAPCARGAKLAFQVTPGSYSSFAAIAEAPDGTTLWLYPSTEPGRSVDLTGLGASGVIPEAVVLDGPPGEYVVTGLFTTRPLTRTELREAFAHPEASGAATVTRRVEAR